MRYLLFALVSLGCLWLTGCAPEPSCEGIDASAESAGIVSGFLHGLVFPVALLGKLVGIDTGLYAVNNSGFWYWLGYVVGFGGLYGGILGRR